jgi:hypothetical protein
MRSRYGLDRNPWPVRIGAAAVVVVFLGLLAGVAVLATGTPVSSRLLLWQQQGPDRVDVTFEVRRPATVAVTCVIRAQDSDRVDVGYASTELPPGAEYEQETFRLRVLAPASVVEVLGCGPAGEPLRVQPAAFPPGVVPPAQPWSPAA